MWLLMLQRSAEQEAETCGRGVSQRITRSKLPTTITVCRRRHTSLGQTRARLLRYTVRSV